MSFDPITAVLPGLDTQSLVDLSFQVRDNKLYTILRDGTELQPMSCPPGRDGKGIVRAYIENRTRDNDTIYILHAVYTDSSDVEVGEIGKKLVPSTDPNNAFKMGSDGNPFVEDLSNLVNELTQTVNTALNSIREIASTVSNLKSNALYKNLSNIDTVGTNKIKDISKFNISSLSSSDISLLKEKLGIDGNYTPREEQPVLNSPTFKLINAPIVDNSENGEFDEIEELLDTDGQPINLEDNLYIQFEDEEPDMYIDEDGNLFGPDSISAYIDDETGDLMVEVEE